MVTNKLGYSIEQCGNDIHIHLPQTPKTLTNTLEPVSNRKEKLTPNDLAGVLFFITYMFEHGPEGEKSL